MSPEDERRLRLSEQRIAGIVDIAADAIISLDGQRVINMFNHSAEDIFGYTAGEIIGKSLDVLIPQRFRSVHSDHIADFARSQIPARRMGERKEIFGLRKDGSEFPAEAAISKLEVSGERIFTVVLRDITFRKRQQDELEAKVTERTEALQDEIRRREATQAALARSQRMDALGQLTGGIAHDSNNLLTVITGNLELLEDDLAGHPGLKYLKQAQEAAMMGARLNQRLLTFSRRRKLAAEIVNLNDQVLNMSELLRRTLGETISIATELQHDLWLTRADRSEIENAVLNLAINARDAMPAGGNLRLETRNTVIDQDAAQLEDGLTPGEYVCFGVTDTGTGMPPDIMRRVFEPFFTTKEAGKGTGLGLATIYGFVKQSQGHVTIYSEVGIGTTVNVYLPRIASTGEDATKDNAGPPVASVRGDTILVVEDNSQVRALTVERLTRLGYVVIEAENGPAALATLAQLKAVDLVFSDVVMPGGLSGFQLAQKIKEANPAARVLLTSGFSEEAASSTDTGQHDIKILRKPYSLAELSKTIREALEL